MFSISSEDLGGGIIRNEMKLSHKCSWGCETFDFQKFNLLKQLAITLMFLSLFWTIIAFVFLVHYIAQ